MTRKFAGVDAPTITAGTLFGAAVPKGRATSSTEFDAARCDAVEAAATAEAADRLGEAGGLPKNANGKRRVPFGPAPTKQQRRVFVAKFNPGESDQNVGRFLESDAWAVDDLWDLNGQASNWISDQLGHNRTTQAHQRIGAGDFIFVFRSQPKVDGVVLEDTSPMSGRPHLIGVWWAVRALRRQLSRPAVRVVTDVWHMPIVKFDDPVDVAVIRRHPELQDISPFTDRTRSALVEASPVEAAAIVAACSLPSYVLTEPDPISIARKLSGVRTGMRDVDLRYRKDSRAKYEFIHAIERAAVQRVESDLTGAGWSVVSREHAPNWGADLDCVRDSKFGLEGRQVEVKGKRGNTWRDVVLQRSQYERARRSAQAWDGQWWLAICRNALKNTKDDLMEFPADWVAQRWPIDQIR